MKESGGDIIQHRHCFPDCTIREWVGVLHRQRSLCWWMMHSDMLGKTRCFPNCPACTGDNGRGYILKVKLSSCTSSLLSSHDTIQGISVLISPSLAITCIYVLPASDFSYHLTLLNLVNSLSSENNHLIVGDFNLPDIDWDSMSTPSICSEMFCEGSHLQQRFMSTGS